MSPLHNAESLLLLGSRRMLLKQAWERLLGFDTALVMQLLCLCQCHEPWAQVWWGEVHLLALGTAKNRCYLGSVYLRLVTVWPAGWNGIKVCCLKYITSDRQNHGFKCICMSILSRITPDCLSSGWTRPFPCSSGCIPLAQSARSRTDASAAGPCPLCCI